MKVSDDRSVDVAQAISEGRIRPVYMSLVDLATDRVVAVEALARWYQPSGEVVAPDDFIPAAEASGVILDLDLAIAGQAMTDLRVWHQKDPELRVTVNLSGRHFASTACIDQLAGLASSTGVDPTRVVLELTETIRPRDLDLAGEVARHLRRLGFSLWLDDFGTGWSGLSDLLHFPVDGIKIDRPFAQQLGSATADAVIAATTGLADTLGLTVTIEGIEERSQATQARALGCHLGQGFLWPGEPSTRGERRAARRS